MSEAGRKKIKLWDGVIEYDEPVPDARTEAAKATIEVGLAAFEEHKEAILAILRNVHGRGLKSEPCDQDKSWRHLTSLAGICFWWATVKQVVVPAAQRRERLHDLATALGRARRMAEKAMQDEVGNDLFSAWHEANVRYDLDPTGPLTLVRIDHEFAKLIAGLATLQTAARRAADDVRPKGGRPKGGFFPRGCIEGLAAVYLNGTGLTPGAGDGPFARFVMKFLTAVGRDDIEYEIVIDAIKNERQRALMRPAASGADPSPFDR
jgi:hypothetical protein